MEAVRVETAEAGIVLSVRPENFRRTPNIGSESYRDDEELLTAGVFCGSPALAYVYQPIIISSHV
jgi:hypothetical protein